LRPGQDSTPARVLLSHAVEQVIDIQADPEFHPTIKRLSRNRTSLGVPLLRGSELEGIFLLGRTHVEPFTQRQIELVHGLGLSISHDIIVKQHGGSIAVDSRLGEYTKFVITLPRTTVE
jgi:GAF domain-containing protein